MLPVCSALRVKLRVHVCCAELEQPLAKLCCAWLELARLRLCCARLCLFCDLLDRLPVCGHWWDGLPLRGAVL